MVRAGLPQFSITDLKEGLSCSRHIGAQFGLCGFLHINGVGERANEKDEVAAEHARSDGRTQVGVVFDCKANNSGQGNGCYRS